jgi:hypothetical protein
MIRIDEAVGGLMKQHPGLVLLLALFTSSSCLAYEVILKNGKVLSGEVVSDNQEMLTLRDSSGIQLKIRHDQIDVAQTRERNQKAHIVEAPAPQTQPVAEQEKAVTAKPKTKARVYTKEDLEKMPELSIIGTNETAEEAANKNKRKDQTPEGDLDEAAWSKEALRIDDRIQQASKSYEYNKSLCDRVVPDLNDLRDGPYMKLTAEQYEEQRRFACSKADQAAKDLEAAEAEYENFLEKARKAGIPPGVVDADRIRN